MAVPGAITRQQGKPEQMKTRKSQLTLVASAFAMAVALAGCGTGGTALNGGSNVPGSSTIAASFAETWTAQHSAIQAAISGAQGTLDALDNGASNTALEMAEARITAITSAIDAGTYLSEAEKTSYRTMQTALRSALMVRREGVMAQGEAERLNGELTRAMARYMAAEGMQTLPEDASMDTEAQAQLRAAMARYMAAEGMQTLPEDASMDTEAQAQLRAAMARYAAAEGMQTLPEDASMDTEAQAQLRAAMARYAAAEGMQTLPEDASMDTEAQAQLRAAMARYAAAEGMQTLPEDASMDTEAQAQLRAAMARYAAAEGMQTLPEDASMDTEAQAQLRAAMARYAAAEGMQTLPEDASMDTEAQAQLRAAMARYAAAEGMQTLPEDASMDTEAQAQLRAAMARYAAAEGMQTLPEDASMDTEAQAQLRAAMARYAAAEGMQTLPEDASMDTEAQAQLRAAMARYAAAEGMQTLPEDASMDTEAQAQLRKAMADLATANAKLAVFDDANDLNESVAELMTLSAAATEDGSARMMAMKYSGMLDADDVKGSSEMARENAQKVLDAQTMLKNTLAGAERDKMTAETARDGLPDDADPALVKVLQDAINAADMQIKKAREVLDATGTGSLATYVALVTGTDADDLKDADDIAKGVAEAVGGALLPTVDTNGDTPDGTARRVNFYATSGDLTGASPPAVMDRTFRDNNSKGMTWAMIVGEANVKSERLGTGNASRMVASVAGMTASEVDTDLTATGGTNSDGKYADAFTSTDSTFKGIVGDVFCLGSDCEVNTTGNLVGSWYFSPTNETAIYVRGTDDEATTEVDESQSYVADTDFVSWGHWLTRDATSGDVTIHTYAVLAADGNTADLDLAVTTGSAAELETASYLGAAAGMSLHKTFDSQGNVGEIYSGAFTADVSLTARFGSAPMLKGRVSGFQGGHHVDPLWSVTLQEAALDGSSSALAAGSVAKGSGQAGDWTAQGYGESGERPTGFFGNFEAHFTDGHASGVYATR